MPSSLVVKVKEIEEIQPHINADNLELAIIEGWQCVIQKGTYQAGSKVVYVPIDSCIPKELSDSLNITQYLGSNGRVKAARLRGEASYGVIMPVAEDTWALEQDVAEHYGITKYEPPLNPMQGKKMGYSAPRHPLFAKYTGIENLRNYKRVFTDGEPVTITIKTHGTNSAIAIIDGEEMASSHQVQRKLPETGEFSLYWEPWSIEGVREMMWYLYRVNGEKPVILFGELYGNEIQRGFKYDMLPNRLGYRAFDLMVDSKYQDRIIFRSTLGYFKVPMMPELYVGPYSLDMVKRLASEKDEAFEKENIREGVVVKPVVETFNPKIGRKILKYISDDYLLSKHPDSKDE